MNKLFLACLLMLVLNLPADSLATLNITATVSSVLGLSGSPVTSIQAAPGQYGASIFETSDIPTEVAAAINFGNLAGGDGSPCIASIGLRSRGNIPCHISVGVSNYSASNLTYSGNYLQGNSGNELNFITLGSGNVSAGEKGNPSGHNYGVLFQGASTLNQLNSGVISQITTNSNRFATFTSPPSLAGNLQSSNNFVQDICTLAIPTGLVWGSTGSGVGNFSLTLQFEIFPGV